MARAKDSAAVVARKIGMLNARLEGQSSASSAGLSAAFGIDAEQVRKILQSKRIHDDG